MNNQKTIHFFGLIVLLLVLFSGSCTYAQTGYADIEGHWAKESIIKWSDLGVVKGSNGMFRPDDTISRAEMIVMINRLLVFPAENNNAFTDVSANDWFAKDVFAMARQSLVRHEGSLFQPNTRVTREEATETLSNAFGISRQTQIVKDKAITVFKDQADIAKNAYPAIKEMVREGFVSGYSDGTFRPHKNVTRAEFVRILDNMVDYIITTPGVYGGPYAKNLLIMCDDVTLAFGEDTEQPAHIYVSPNLQTGKLSISSTLTGRAYVYKDYNFQRILLGEKPLYSMFWAIDRPVTREAYDGFARGYGTKTYPYCIETEEQLKRLHNYVIDRKLHTTDYFEITSDIVLVEPWEAIGYTQDYIYRIEAKVDGKGHTISNLNITGSDQCSGLFADYQGSLSNLNIQGKIDIKADKNNTIYSAGGFAAVLVGKITNCTSAVDITVKGGEVVMVGGLVGEASVHSNVTGCKYDGTLVAEATPETISFKNAEAYAGGIVGYCYAPLSLLENPSEPRSKPTLKNNLENCTTSGDYSATSSAKNQRGKAYVGGLAGFVSMHKLQGSTSSANISAKGGYFNFAGGLVGVLSDPNESYIGDEYVESYLVESYATGNVAASDASYQNNAGGAVGQVNNGVLQSCFATGRVNGSGDPVYFNAIGGLVGSVYEHGKIRDSYATGNASSRIGDALVGAVVGRVVGSVERCYGTGKAIVESANINGQNQDLYMGSWTTEIFTNFYHCISDSEAMKGLVYLCFTREPQTAVNVFNKEIYKVETYKELGFDMDKIWFMSNTGYPLPKLRGVNELLQERFVVPERF